MTPSRVQSTIAQFAERYETTVHRILNGDRSTETAEARRALIVELAQTDKPSGRKPKKAEIARWLNIDPSRVLRVLET